MSADDAAAPRHRLHPGAPRWTHIALPCHDLDASLAWYARYTPLELLDRRRDADGQAAWLGHPDQADTPFILVLVNFDRDRERGPRPTMAPFAHLGIEVPTRDDIGRIAAMAEADGCLVWKPTDLPDPVGYVCAVRDPDGNVVEFSHDQGVYDKARQIWG